MESKSKLQALVVDQVHRYTPSGIRVLIIGAGPGGLQAALECWRKGHSVQVLERADSLSTLGDVFTITPSGLATLDKYPTMKAEYNEQIHDNIITWYSAQGHFYFESEPEWHRGVPHAAGNQRISFLKMRNKFAEMQFNQAVRLGIPVLFGREVVEYHEDTDAGEVRVQCKSGEVFVADVVVAADGIRSLSHKAVTGHAASVYPTGFAIARTMFSREHIKAGSLAETLLPKPDQRPEFRICVGPGLHLILFLNHDGVGFAHTHKSDTAAESWHDSVITSEQVLSTLGPDIESWDPAIVDLIRQIPASTRIVDWKLSWRDCAPAWVSQGGRIVQLGDAAHSFLPTSGNGATQALEDAFSIAECLRLGGRSMISWSTKVHQLLRYERVTTIQKTGFVNRNSVHRAWAELASGGAEAIETGRNTYYRQGAWLWQHNSSDYATENYWKALAHLQQGTPFTNTNLEPGTSFEPWTVEGVLAEEALKDKAALEKLGSAAIAVDKGVAGF